MIPVPHIRMPRALPCPELGWWQIERSDKVDGPCNEEHKDDKEGHGYWRF